MKQLMLSAAILFLQVNVFAGNNEAPIPVIYCTDLFHPHDDPDDHFDLACIYAISEFDIKAIILDQGRKQKEKPGRIPIEQTNHLTSRTVPYEIGLAHELKSPDDTGKQQPDEFQCGVEAILSILDQSSGPVTVITVGSLRDIAAAYNREPELLQNKVSRIYMFIGEAQGAFQEYNVGLDVNAYKCIMNAPLPIYWIPCFDGGAWVNEGNASFWRAKHEELLADASAPLLNFFIYAMLQKNEDDPLAAMRAAPVNEEKERVLADTRNLWCCAVFPYMAGRKYVQRNETYLALPEGKIAPYDRIIEPFTFSTVKLRVDEKGTEFYDDAEASPAIHRFHVNDLEIYPEVMTSVTTNLLKELSHANDWGN